MATHNLERFQSSPAQETGGFLFLEASDAPLSPLELPVPEPEPPDPNALLNDDNVFFRGWYGLEPAGEKPAALGWQAAFVSAQFQWTRLAAVGFRITRDRRQPGRSAVDPDRRTRATTGASGFYTVINRLKLSFQ
ncbi:MAG: hypothetical protein IPL59_11515 [Candidatus Competibacteraceae bacterium]|nr:hypothetical protein [Candidatus Competibacteraceae bacterium]